jgi:hypothetical protein
MVFDSFAGELLMIGLNRLGGRGDAPLDIGRPAVV